LRTRSVGRAILGTRKIAGAATDPCHCRYSQGKYAAPYKPASFPSVAFSIAGLVARNVYDRSAQTRSISGANKSHAGSGPPLNK
jgi:hypothetical protein